MMLTRHAKLTVLHPNSSPPNESKKPKKPPRRPQENAVAADDSDDDRWLIYEIDTAFGLLPCGGVYKESNHYFGPGPDYAY